MQLLILLLVAAALHAAPVIRTVKTSGGDHAATIVGLQAAVDHCRTLNQTDPCIVEIEAGITITGSDPDCSLLLNAQQNVTKPILIRSSRISELPPADRVTAADASKLAKITATCASTPGVIIIPPETTGVLGTGVASHYWLQGLEIHYAAEGRNAGGALNIGLATNGSTKALAYWQAPRTITVDRCWVHGNDTETWVAASSTHANQNGVRVDGRNIAVKNSLIDHNNMDSVDHGQGESHGLAGSNAPGPLYVENNKIDGAITSLIGGEWTWIPGLVSTGGFFYGNEFTRNPYAWHWLDWDTTDTLKTDEPCITGSFFQQVAAPSTKYKCVAGAWQPTSDSRPNRGWTKNGFEFKSIRLARVLGNYIHTIPSTGDQSQYGFCWLINSVDGQEGAYFARVEDVEFEFNHCHEAAQGPTLAGLDYPVYKRNNNIRMRHNLISKMGGARVSPTQGTIYTTGGGWGFQASWVGTGLTWTKNTTLYDRAFGGGGMRLEDSGISNVDIRDNIGFWGSVGQAQIDDSNEACSNFASSLLGGSYWNYIGLVDTNSRGSGAFSSLYGGSQCPANITRAADIAAVKFVDANSGDYRLCTDTDTPAAGCTASPFATAASDGGPLGADAQQVSRMTAGAVSGTYDAKLFGMQIRGYSGNDLRYTPYDAGGSCTVRVKKGNTATHNQNDSIEGGLLLGDRTMSVGTSGAGEYVARITCRDVAGTEKGWREFMFKRYN